MYIIYIPAETLVSSLDSPPPPTEHAGLRVMLALVVVRTTFRKGKWSQGQSVVPLFMLGAD